MGFLKIISRKKFTLISTFLLFYVILNLLDGERGLISYYEKLKIKKQLSQEYILLTKNLDNIEKENNLLTNVINIDYLETLYREKFMVGKKNEKVFLYK